MEIKMDISLQTRQVLSQVQMQSLNILSMSMTELQEFLQKEEIENPLIDYTPGRIENEISVSYRDHERFYSRRNRDGEEPLELYEEGKQQQSLEDLIMSQLSWNRYGDREKRIVEFCLYSLDESGYLTITEQDIARELDEEWNLVSGILSELKTLEPKGIFASGLEECLTLQVAGMKNEKNLTKLIRDHLGDMAEGRIGSISGSLKIPPAEVRKLIRVIRDLNPKPLNGYGENRIHYVCPDVILGYWDGQWNISLNDSWTGSIGVSEFYIRMMEEAQDAELKAYFEEKLRRARQIVEAVEQRRKTLEAITVEIVKIQAGYLAGKEDLKPMTLEHISEKLGIHKSTVSRAIREKYLLAPAGCLLIRSLFTKGIASRNEDGDDITISRNTVKDRLKQLIDREDKRKPYSDEALAELLEQEGILVSRRTVAKYRMELGIKGAFGRKE